MNRDDHFPEFLDEQPDTLLEDEDQPISKSQIKRECHALQDLGEAMARLKPADLERIPLDDKVRDAVIAVRKMKKGGALKRQVQYIGKLLRNVEVEPIREAYEKVMNPYREDTRQLHKLEQWRDRLLTEKDAALEELINDYPQVDRQHLRQLIRQAQKEQTSNKPPKSSREIFQYLRQLMSN